MDQSESLPVDGYFGTHLLHQNLQPTNLLQINFVRIYISTQVLKSNTDKFFQSALLKYSHPFASMILLPAYSHIYICIDWITASTMPC